MIFNNWEHHQIRKYFSFSEKTHATILYLGIFSQEMHE